MRRHSHRGFEGGGFSVSFFPSRFFFCEELSLRKVSGFWKTASIQDAKKTQMTMGRRERFLGLRRRGRGQQREGIDRDDDAD